MIRTAVNSRLKMSYNGIATPDFGVKSPSNPLCMNDDEWSKWIDPRGMGPLDSWCQGYLSTEGLKGCMGTLGYLAPEVVTAGLSNENAYTDKCDIWSLGATCLR